MYYTDWVCIPWVVVVVVEVGGIVVGLVKPEVSEVW
jgi:hypothetical protein